MEVPKVRWKEWGMDILADIAGGMLVAAGIHNFALYAEFPVAGFSGLAIILYHLFGLPVGAGVLLLNIPASVFCYRFLGREFFIKSLRTMVIYTILLDYAAPLLPVYEGSRLLAALCMGILVGSGFALIFMRGTSTGGQDFIMMTIKRLYPHITLGAITFILNLAVIAAGSLMVFRDIDGLIYGVIVTYLTSSVMNRIMYGTYEGKLAFIVTERGEDMAKRIDEYSGRGSTRLKGMGSYTGEEKEVVMCACNNKQMYAIKRLAREIDPQAFTVIVESNEVVGEGFKSVGIE